MATRIIQLLLISSIFLLYQEGTIAANVKRDFTPLIVGGQPASIEEFPYQVSIRRWGNHICGGSIINPTTIVTAASCISLPIISLTIRAGSSYRSSGGQVIPITISFIHPLYNSITRENDIAVIKLVQPLEFDSAVQPIGIPSQGSEQGLGEGTLLTATGWGNTRDGGELSEQLMQVQFPAVSQDDCKAAYAIGAIKDSMFCAGFPQGGKGTCQGDIGGPLVAGGTLIGVVSWSYGCARPSYPVVNTKLSSYTNFIQLYTLV